MVDIWDCTPEQRVEHSQENKNLGSEIFKDQDYKSAGEYYIKAIRDLIPIIEPSSGLEETVKSLLVACYSNLAACQLKLQQFDRVILNCDKSLSLDSTNVKSIFRRATANIECKNLDEAQRDINLMYQLDPRNTATKELGIKFKKLTAEKDKADAKIMEAYFNG